MVPVLVPYSTFGALFFKKNNALSLMMKTVIIRIMIKQSEARCISQEKLVNFSVGVWKIVLCNL